MAGKRRAFGGYGRFEYEDKKSVFIAEAVPVASEEDARAFLDKVRREHHDAKHHVFAYQIGELCRYSDDGEPQGTGGLPVLGIIRSSGADGMIVVTRYFGGVLLGTGGLTRAYGGAAKGALEAAGIVTFETYAVYRLTAAYADYDRLATPLARFGAVGQGLEYGAEVTADYAVRENLGETFEKTVADLTAGRVKAIRRGTVEYPEKENAED